MAGGRGAHYSPDSSKPKHPRDVEGRYGILPYSQEGGELTKAQAARPEKPIPTDPPTLNVAHNLLETRGPYHEPQPIFQDLQIPPNTHSKHERKTNRSTRMHSLRNVISHGGLPPNIQIEKERELAALIFDQQKDKLKAESSQMISRYHKVRFFERKKAERKVKQLTSQWEKLSTAQISSDGDGIEGDPSGEETRLSAEKAKQLRIQEINQQIRDAQVDLNYAIYSPLSEKYISIFADGPVKSRFR